MLCGPQSVFLLDSVSTGLDSSTTFDIMSTIKVNFSLLPYCSVLAWLLRLPSVSNWRTISVPILFLSFAAGLYLVLIYGHLHWPRQHPADRPDTNITVSIGLLHMEYQYRASFLGLNRAGPDTHLGIHKPKQPTMPSPSWECAERHVGVPATNQYPPGVFPPAARCATQEASRSFHTTGIVALLQPPPEVGGLFSCLWLSK